MLPLHKIRVLDLTRVVPGPHCTMLLADMGADVLIIEPPAIGMSERDAAQNMLRRNKRSLCVDLKHDDGQKILRELARNADVLIEGFRPKVVERLGADDATLRAANPGLVYCSLSGYGQDGPYADLVGHDINYISIGGALGLIGRPGAPPSIPLQLVGDLAGGALLAAFSIMVALFARTETGQGQYIDVAMSDGVVSLLTRTLSQYFASGVVPGRGEHRITGALHHYDVYMCKDGRYLSVGALEPRFYENLCRVLGHPGYAALQEDAPPAKREEIRAAFARTFLSRTRDEWFDLLRAEDTCVAPVLSLDEVASNPHHLHRGMFVSLPHPELGEVRQVGVAPKLSETPGSVRTLGPRPGAHTTEVLRALGYSDAEIDRLIRASTIA